MRCWAFLQRIGGLSQISFIHIYIYIYLVINTGMMRPYLANIQQGARQPQRMYVCQQVGHQGGVLHQHLMRDTQFIDYHEVNQTTNMINPNGLHYWNSQNNHSQIMNPRLRNQFYPPQYSIQQGYFTPLTSSIPVQDIITPPLDHPDPYIHYQFLSSLKQTHHYSASTQVPHNLVNYFLNYLSLENCQYSKTALSYIVTNIKDFTQSFAEHEIEFLVKIVRRKYPCNIDYEKEYQKIVLMDQQQAEKLVELLEILCVVFCQIEGWRIKYSKKYQANQIEGDQYLAWIINYTLVIFQHVQHIKKMPTNQEAIEKANKLVESLASNKKQILCLFQQQRLRKTQKNLEPISKIIYKSISKESIMMEMAVQNKEGAPDNQWNTIKSFIQVFIEICDQANMDGPFVLLQFIKAQLLDDMREITGKISRISGKIDENEEIRGSFEKFSVKCLNLLILLAWNNVHKLQIIQILASCRLLCQLNHEETGHEYAQIIRQAFEISKYANSLKKKRQVHQQKSSNDLELTDDW